MTRNNAHDIFSNTTDSLNGLRAMLGAHLTEVTVEVVGCVGIFAGRTSDRPGHGSAHDVNINEDTGIPLRVERRVRAGAEPGRVDRRVPARRQWQRGLPRL